MSRQRLVVVLKLLLAGVILGAIGWQFSIDLRDERLQSLSIRVLWLIGAAGVYLLAIGFSGLFWLRLMHLFDQPVAFWPAMKAYYIGHLGKYVPGKAWALLLRGGLVKGPGVSLGVAIVTAFYEVLTTMAGGALVAAVVFFIEEPVHRGLDFPPYLTGLLLLVACGVPLLPGVFNLLAQRLARRFVSLGVLHVPRLRLSVLAQGLAIVALGWGLMGVSLWMGLCSILEPTPPLTAGNWAYFCAIIGLAYVAGFAVPVAPGGIGVREYVLREFLQFITSAPLGAVTALLIRLSWTAGEVILAAVLGALVRRPFVVNQTNAADAVHDSAGVKDVPAQ